VLASTDPAQPTVLVFHFPPQHATDVAFFQDNNATLPAGPVPVRGWLARASRLAFQLPSGVDTVPVTLDALLDWQSLRRALPAMRYPTTRQLTRPRSIEWLQASDCSRG
jgi:hypothetical protein